MPEPILPKLEAARKELLDLGLRNPLISYKRPKSKGLLLADEKSEFIYDILVRQNKSMSFLGRQENEENPLLFTDPSPDELQQAYVDTKLQTVETETGLQKKLLAIYYAARTSLEEQGVNILYITLGMLQWYESDASQEAKLAPLILIPVTLDRSSATERFRLRYSQEDIGHNLSLQAKLKAEFNISLPDLETSDDISVSEYFNQVSKHIKKQGRWTVKEDHIELGFFSFGKFMIYHDLDNANWPEESKPVDHPILQSLFSDGFKDGRALDDDDLFIDTDTIAHELFQVVDADSSQILAMLSVHEGKNMVIQGPPGTGKSQTITNLIANAVGQGKKVLFVAEKMAALEVVKRRLDNIGLGEACLELHSHKANKKELHEELKRVLDLGKPAIEQLEADVAFLEKNKKEINDYCIAVNSKIGSSGLSTHQVIGYLMTIAERTAGVQLPKVHIPFVQEWTAEKQSLAEQRAERLQETLKKVGVPCQLLFWASDLRSVLPHEKLPLKEQLNSSLDIVESLRSESIKVAQVIGVNDPVNRQDSLNLCSIVQTASAKPELQEINITSKSWLHRENDVREILETGERWTAIRQQYEEQLVPEAWEQNVLELRSHLKTHGEKWYKFLISDYNKANKQLKSYCKSGSPKELSVKLEFVEAILEYNRLQQVINEHQPLINELFGSRWQKLKTDWPALRKAFEYLFLVHKQVVDHVLPKELLAYLERHEDKSVAAAYYNSLSAALAEHGRSVQQVVDKLKINEQRLEQPLLHQLYINQSLIFSEWYKRIDELELAISWNIAVDLSKEDNLTFLTDVSNNWECAKDWLKEALQTSWYHHLLEQALAEFPALRKFERANHEELIKQFRRLDQLKFQYNRAQAALTHWQNRPNMEMGGQIRILRGEFNRKARHMPIRKLMQEAGAAIQLIKPVFMMSPLSIANFLSQGCMEFDLVIFDEASQVRPVDALGAILRGKQLVVVGDTKQLPPTSFFDTLNDATEDEDNVTADLQSILGMCDAQGAPQKMLRWHYRSRHESLITLSNHEFYENRLVVFPSPGSRQRMGLVYHHLTESAYDRGQSKTNQKEAEFVAQCVMEHARKNPKQSLGVVAFSSAQREAIADALEMKRRAAPDLEDFFKTHTHEPFFVKNLENVQGDERDVIFISIGYGRTKEGYVSMSFGPLNNEGGERRLNVLITRAKLRCEVFTNLTSSDIDISRTNKRGVVALKSFLHFAQHGKLDVPVITGKPFDSPFEESVAEQLTKHGYTVRQQVGSAGFYLDLAIVDPEHPGRYLLGIECDGAAYHSARSARDRDRLRQQVLEGIGWRIHRIWSTDWFRNPEKELKRVVEAIEKAKQVFSIDDEIEDQYVIESTIKREESTVEVTEIPFYVMATLGPEPATKELHLHAVGKLAGWVEQVVNVESPVHVDEVVRRIAEAAGVGRIGSRIKTQIMLAVKFAAGSKKIKLKSDFLWSPEMTAPIIRNRTFFPAASKKIKYIAPEELSLAIEKVVKESIAIEPDAAIPFIGKLFGFSRITEDMRDEILLAVKKTLRSSKIQKDGNVLKAV